MRKKKSIRYINRTRTRSKPKSKGIRKETVYFLIFLALFLAISIVKFPPPDYSGVEQGTIRAPSETETKTASETEATSGEDLAVLEYTGSPYCEINGNVPAFSEVDEELLKTKGYEYYSALDGIGRCGYCEACVGPETQPEGEERGEIWTVHPSGWRSGQGWERCHLIAWALTGENANDHNLVTGTHYMNVEGMLPFEIEVAEAADRGIHVMYRVTPVYKGYEPICRGVNMAAKSIEDDSVSFNVYVFNVEPGKTVDYISGYVK